MAVLARYTPADLGRAGDERTLSLVLGELWEVEGGIVWMRALRPVRVFKSMSLGAAVKEVEGIVRTYASVYLMVRGYGVREISD